MLATIRRKISIVQGDITKLDVDVIVNAANRSLLGGGGVDGAIHDAAGDGLYDECKKLNGCDVGDAKITGAHDIEQVKAIIHAVGPQVHGSVKEKDRLLLASCYKTSLDLAKKNGFKSIAFPCISTGIYRFPNFEAAKVVFKTTREWFSNEENANEIFCVFLPKDKVIYDKFLSVLEERDAENKVEKALEDDEVDADNAAAEAPEAENKAEVVTEEARKPVDIVQEASDEAGVVAEEETMTTGDAEEDGHKDDKAIDETGKIDSAAERK